MKAIELIGGPFDGACAAQQGVFLEGAHIVVKPDDDDVVAIYTFRNGLLEFDPALTFRGEFE